MFSILGVICVGDKTSCGATVMTGSPQSNVAGRPIARVGDSVSCKYACKIITGSQQDIIDGSVLAIHGSQTTRGCMCISQNNDDTGLGQNPTEMTAVSKAADSALAYMPSTSSLLAESDCVEFRLTSSDGEPLAGIEYQLTLPDASVVNGRLDSDGYARIEGAPRGKCQVSFPSLAMLGTV